MCNVFHVPFLFENVHPKNHIKNFTPQEPVSIYLNAVIVSDPVSQPALYNRIKTTFTADCRGVLPASVRGQYAPTIVNNSRLQFSVCGLINVVSFDSCDTSLKYGDNILIKGSLSRPFTLSNPGVFNYRIYLAYQDIYSVVTVKKGDFITVISKNKANNFIGWALNIRHVLIALIKKYLPATEGDILTGVLLGDRSGIKEDLNDRFIKTGTVHILAISGWNVGLVASIFILFFRLLYFPRSLVYLMASLLLIIYAVLTGANIPVVRATIMAVALLIGLAFGKKADILNCLGLGGIIILLKNPSALFDAGFQLSFVTVVSMVIFAPKFEEFFGVNNEQFWLKKYTLRSLAVSFAAWLGIVPIVAYYFNMVSPICILANIPVVFILSFVVASGLVFLSIGMFVPFLAGIFAESAGFLAGILIKTVIIFSDIPYGFFRMHSWNFFEIVFFYLALGIIGINLYNKKISKAYSVMAVLLFLNIFVWMGIIANANNELRVSILDVGHGDAIVLEFPKGGVALIDAGPAQYKMDAGEDIITPYLLNRRINIIDAVFITHPDDDHYGGVMAILKNFKVRNVFDSGDINAESKNFLIYQKIVKEKQIPHYKLKRFDRIIGFGAGQMFVLNPPSKYFSGTSSDRNNNSIVIKLAYGKFSFLFCGDIKEAAAKDLLAYSRHLKSDFIKIPHHGTSMGMIEDAFLKNVSGHEAFISADSDDISCDLTKDLLQNRYKVYETYRHGAIIVLIKNNSYAIEVTKGINK